MPNMGYYEFLPVDCSISVASQLVNLARLETGYKYAVVVTTYAGLNWYGDGNVLPSTTPRHCSGHKNVTLFVDANKTDEAEPSCIVRWSTETRAWAAPHRPHGAAVMEYMSRVCTKNIPRHYVICWELMLNNETDVVNGDVLDKCCLEMEGACYSAFT